ncbi:hypothetical protein [Clostridium tertium]|uniref:hypothetical protein n=1 Tax=Clostridium tertium TaxID=1559 RepID=UPI0023B335AB|nr:hypothetical protein [Clostridium tertium]
MNNKRIDKLISLIQEVIYKRVIFKKVNDVCYEQIEAKKFIKTDDVIEILINELSLKLMEDE